MHRVFRHVAGWCGVVMIALSVRVVAQTRPSPCDSCATVPSLLSGWLARPLSDTTFNIEHPTRGLLVRNVRRLERCTVSRYGRPLQALHVWYSAGGACADTILVLSEPLLLRRGGVGGSYEPVSIPIRPAREFYRGQAPSGDGLLLSVGVIGAYGGNDTSARAIGFKSLLGGARVLVGTTIAPRLQAALGAELLSEGGRLRIPLLGHLRWSPFGGGSGERSYHFVPSACQFLHPGDPVAEPAGVDYHAVDAPGDLDSTVYFAEETHGGDGFRPFLFVEAGVVFNGGFQGAGAEPSLNSSEYGQYLAGIGVGAPIVGPLTLGLGYRYMRLNLRTPCPTCTEQYVVNTNRIHAVMLTIEWKL